jgi:putative sugar O-methyltransferase
MNQYPELTQARNDMLVQSRLYQSTFFWQEASSKIVTELYTHGLEQFRSLHTALCFFVPTYGQPGGGFSQSQSEGLLGWIETNHPNETKPKITLYNFLIGRSWALADYRVLRASDDPQNLPYLHNFSESNVGQPVEQFEFNGQYFSRSSLNYLLGLAMLKKHLNGEVPQNVLEIGGGFGTLGEILANSGISDLHYIDIDIPPTSFVAQYYLSKVLGKASVATYNQTANKKVIMIKELPIASVFCSWQIEKLEGQIDLFVNFISFQEMEPTIVKNYLSHVARLGSRWVLLRNLKEGKNISKNDSVGVINPILSEDYLAMLPGYELVERNIIPFGYQTVDGFNSELLLLKLKG